MSKKPAGFENWGDLDFQLLWMEAHQFRMQARLEVLTEALVNLQVATGNKTGPTTQVHNQNLKLCEQREQLILAMISDRDPNHAADLQRVLTAKPTS